MRIKERLRPLRRYIWRLQGKQWFADDGFCEWRASSFEDALSQANKSLASQIYLYRGEEAANFAVRITEPDGSEQLVRLEGVTWHKAAA